MNDKKTQRLAAASGYLAVLLGMAAASFERGAPTTNASIEDMTAFFRTYQSELLYQSLFFILSAAAMVWFLASLRAYLLDSEQAPGRLSNLIFNVGVLYAGFQLILQSVQVTMVMNIEAGPEIVAVLGDLAYVVSVVAYIPFAVLLTAHAVLIFRHKAFPIWIGWLSAVGAAANIMLVFGLVSKNTLLVPGGILTYVVYMVIPVWQIATTTVMLIRLGRK